MTLTYYLITRGILISLPLGYMFYLARNGKWGDLNEEAKGGLLMAPVLCLIPYLLEFLLFAISPVLGFLFVAMSIAFVFVFSSSFIDDKLNSYSKKRNLVIKAEQSRQSPTSGQLGVANDFGGLAVVDGKNIGKLAVADDIRECLGATPRKDLL